MVNIPSKFHRHNLNGSERKEGGWNNPPCVTETLPKKNAQYLYGSSFYAVAFKGVGCHIEGDINV